MNYNGPDDSRFMNRDYSGLSSSQSVGEGEASFYEHRRSSVDFDADSTKTLRDYVEVLLRRRWAFVVVASSLFLMGAIFTFTRTPLFASYATLEFEDKKPKQEDRLY